VADSAGRAYFWSVSKISSTIGSLTVAGGAMAIAIVSPGVEMTGKPADDPILKRFKASLDQTYGGRIERVVLFGSRARGDAHADSDYDVAVFFRDLPDRWREMDRLADIGTEILDDEGKFVHAMAYSAGAYRDRTPLMHEVRKDGVDL
jgi:predicted nucleotidyltransferase